MAIIRCRADLARAIKESAAAAGLSLSEVGRRMGVSHPSIARTVNRSDLPMSTLLRVAAALDSDLVIGFLPHDFTPGQ